MVAKINKCSEESKAFSKSAENNTPPVLFSSMCYSRSVIKRNRFAYISALRKQFDYSQRCWLKRYPFSWQLPLMQFLCLRLLRRLVTNFDISLSLSSFSISVGLNFHCVCMCVCEGGGMLTLSRSPHPYEQFLHLATSLLICFRSGG